MLTKKAGYQMAIDYLQCICGHRKYRHYHGHKLCDDCNCQEFRTDLSVTKSNDELGPGDMCVVPDSAIGTSSPTHNGSTSQEELAAEKRGAASSELKDSGERIQFESGMVRDIEDDKPGFHFLIPKNIPFKHQMLTRVAEHLRKGAKKYSPRNWEKGNTDAEAERARESALRHMMQWINGETDEDHAAAVISNIIFSETMQYKADLGKEDSSGSKNGS